jgi:hypothetical protein
MSIMQMARLGALDLPTVVVLLGGATVCYVAWLTSIVFCATDGARLLLIAAARSSRSGSCMVSASGSAAGDCV